MKSSEAMELVEKLHAEIEAKGFEHYAVVLRWKDENQQWFASQGARGDLISMLFDYFEYVNRARLRPDSGKISEVADKLVDLFAQLEKDKDHD